METNSQFMNRFVQFINTADEHLATELISSDAIFYVPGYPEPLKGAAGYMQVVGMMRSGFSDVQWTLEEVVTEQDKIAARYHMTGTHDGSFFGVPPTGNAIKIQSMAFYRLLDGKIIEEHGQPDMLTLLQQIGAIPGK